MRRRVPPPDAPACVELNQRGRFFCANTLMRFRRD
jgi:hypothetical protein